MSNSKFKVSIQTLLDSKGIRGALTGLGKVKHAALGVGSAFRVLRKGISLALAPMRVFITLWGAGAGVVGAFAGSSLKAAGRMEMLREQLRTVMATKKEADAAFKESIQFSVATPFSPEEIVQTRVALEGVGIEGADAVEKTAMAAAGLNRNILDIASAVKSMETEPLRNLGIMLKRDGEKFIISYKDKMKQAREITVDGFANAQQAILDTYADKFGGGLETMSKTWEGKLSTLSGAWMQFKANFGDGILPAMKKVVDDLIAGLTSNNIKSWGEKLGQQIEEGRIKVLATIQTVRDISAKIREHFASGGEGLGQMVNALMINAVTVFFNAFAAALKASIAIWKVIGLTVAGAIKEELLKLDLPGMGRVRKGAAHDAVDAMAPEQRREWLIENEDHEENRTLYQTASDEKVKTLAHNKIESKADNRLTDDELATLGATQSSKITENAFSGFSAEMANVGEKLKDDLSAAADNLSASITKATGSPTDIRKTYENEVAERKTKPSGQTAAEEAVRWGQEREKERVAALEKAKPLYHEQKKQESDAARAGAPNRTGPTADAARATLSRERAETAEVAKLISAVQAGNTSLTSQMLAALQRVVENQASLQSQIERNASQIKNGRS